MSQSHPLSVGDGATHRDVDDWSVTDGEEQCEDEAQCEDEGAQCEDEGGACDAESHDSDTEQDYAQDAPCPEDDGFLVEVTRAHRALDPAQPPLRPAPYHRPSWANLSSDVVPVRVIGNGDGDTVRLSIPIGPLC